MKIQLNSRDVQCDDEKKSNSPDIAVDILADQLTSKLKITGATGIFGVGHILEQLRLETIYEPLPDCPVVASSNCQTCCTGQNLSRAPEDESQNQQSECENLRNEAKACRLRIVEGEMCSDKLIHGGLFLDQKMREANFINRLFILRQQALKQLPHVLFAPVKS